MIQYALDLQFLWALPCPISLELSQAELSLSVKAAIIFHLLGVANDLQWGFFLPTTQWHKVLLPFPVIIRLQGQLE